MLQLRERKRRRQQLEADRLIANLPLEAIECQVNDRLVLKGQRRRFADREPRGLSGVGYGPYAVAADIMTKA